MRSRVVVPPIEELTRYVGPPLAASSATLLGTSDAEHIETTIASYRRRFEELGMFENSLYPGIAEMLMAFEETGHEASVVTAKRYETIRPRGYDGLAAHVHHVVIAAGFKPRLCDLWFGDEPYFAPRRSAGLPLSQGEAMFVRMPTRDADGVWHVTHDLEMLVDSN